MDNTPGGAPTPSPGLAIIAALAADRGIGIDNRLPWRLPEDLKRFKALTWGHRIIMGRKTWESLGRPLPGRENVVLSRSPSFSASGARVVSSLAEAIALPGAQGEVFCIGGAELYRQALPLATRLYLTEIEQSFPADAFFPEFDPAEWRCVERESHRLDDPDGFAYHFATYQRAR